MLPILEKVELTHVGLKGFFCLLFWCHQHDPSRTFIEILRQLHAVARQIRSVRSADYNILRTQYDIGTLAFEKHLFSTESISYFSSNPQSKAALRGKTSIQGSVTSSGLYGRAPLAARFLTLKSTVGREIFIDLMGVARLSDLALHFEKNDEISKFRVIIHAFDLQTGQKSLVLNQLFDEGLWVQLSKYAYDPSVENFFSENEAVETLGLTHLKLNTRYLHLQITHGVQTHIKSLNEKVPLSNIIPEFYGEKASETNSASVQAALPKCMLEVFSSMVENTNLRVTGEVKLQHSSKYDKYEVINNTDALLYDSTGIHRVSQGGKPAEGLVILPSAAVNIGTGSPNASSVDPQNFTSKSISISQFELCKRTAQ